MRLRILMWLTLLTLVLATQALAAVEWRRAEHVPPMKHIVWMQPVRTTGEIPYGCRTRFDDLLPRACLVVPTQTCFIYSAQTQKETPANVKSDLERICSGWFHVTEDYPLMDWATVEGRFPSQSVPKLP